VDVELLVPRAVGLGSSAKINDVGVNRRIGRRDGAQLAAVNVAGILADIHVIQLNAVREVPEARGQVAVALRALGNLPRARRPGCRLADVELRDADVGVAVAQVIHIHNLAKNLRAVGVVGDYPRIHARLTRPAYTVIRARERWRAAAVPRHAVDLSTRAKRRPAPAHRREIVLPFSRYMCCPH